MHEACISYCDNGVAMVQQLQKSDINSNNSRIIIHYKTQEGGMDTKSEKSETRPSHSLGLSPKDQRETLLPDKNIKAESLALNPG